MRSTSLFVAMLVSVVGIAACDVDQLAEETPTPRAQHSNAPQLNGFTLNGNEFNGFTLNGGELNGFTLNGFTLNGDELNGFTLNGSSFSGTRVINGQPQEVSGTQLIGAQMTLIGSTAAYVLSFDDIRLDPQNSAGDVYLYTITVHDITHGTSGPLCLHEGVAAPAIPIANHWDLETGDRIDDPNTATFACRGGALAKCIDWGYRPWASSTRCAGDKCQQVSLAVHHQACTRMVRADYCGDGTPHTIDGTLIDVFDDLSPKVQSRTSTGPLWGVEAEWGPDGAVCIGDALRIEHLDELGIPYETPACLGALERPDCGSFAAPRVGEIANAYCHAWGSDPQSCQ